MRAGAATSALLILYNSALSTRRVAQVMEKTPRVASNESRL